MNKIILFITTFIVVFLMCNKDKDIEIDPRIYGTWKCYFDCELWYGFNAKDTIPISLLNDSLKDSVCYFYTFENNRSFQHYKIDGINYNKLILHNGILSTKGDYYYLDEYNYSVSISNDTLILTYISDPCYSIYFKKYEVCWTEN